MQSRKHLRGRQVFIMKRSRSRILSPSKFEKFINILRMLLAGPKNIRNLLISHQQKAFARLMMDSGETLPRFVTWDAILQGFREVSDSFVSPEP